MGAAADGRSKSAVRAERHHDHRLVRQPVVRFGVERVVGGEEEAPGPVETVVGENAAERWLLVDVRKRSASGVEAIGGDGPLVPTKHFAAGVDAAIALMNRKICRTVDPALLGKPGQFAASLVEGENRDSLSARAVKIGSVARDAANNHKRSFAHASALPWLKRSCAVEGASDHQTAISRLHLARLAPA